VKPRARFIAVLSRQRIARAQPSLLERLHPESLSTMLRGGRECSIVSRY